MQSADISCLGNGAPGNKPLGDPRPVTGLKLQHEGPEAHDDAAAPGTAAVVVTKGIEIFMEQEAGSIEAAPLKGSAGALPHRLSARETCLDVASMEKRCLVADAPSPMRRGRRQGLQPGEVTPKAQASEQETRPSTIVLTGTWQQGAALQGLSPLEAAMQAAAKRQAAWQKLDAAPVLVISPPGSPRQCQAAVQTQLEEQRARLPQSTPQPNHEAVAGVLLNEEGASLQLTAGELSREASTRRQMAAKRQAAWFELDAAQVFVISPPASPRR